MNSYDHYGWYAEDQHPDREAGIAPANISLTEIDGELRANWTGYEWVDLPYQSPPPQGPVLPEVPRSITRRQGKIILSRNGLLDAVEAAIQAMEGQAGVEARIDWADALEWDRGWPLLAQVATGFGLTSEQIDQMFIDASAL